MAGSKMNFGSISEQARQVANDQDAQSFVRGAKNSKNELELTKPKQTTKKLSSRSTPKLVVEGYLKNRKESCGDPIQLYILNDIAQWMEDHAKAGKGGNQILINYLIRKGIKAVEQEYENTGVIFASEGSS
ncbi:MAG: hypothetical protein HC851_18730 [Acaryochloris sp. RU_4_1]|nr:hypothetical protein [Acaryochloris sp. RU_4_1]NJR57058.1 hypothetical protein [Acaryochloris sp. CRU_2_0]